LLDYHARYYSMVLGRFVSADSLVPGAGSPLAWDRYAYVKINPLRYTDPPVTARTMMAVGRAITGLTGNAAAAFNDYFGEVRFIWGDGSLNEDNYCYGNTGGGCTTSATQINFWSLSGGRANDTDRMAKNVVHELGHVYNNMLSWKPVRNMPDWIEKQADLILRPNDFKGRLDWQQHPNGGKSETFADMFIAWTYDAWNLRFDNYRWVRSAQIWMNKWMP